jgi:hypothetical protein
MHRIAWPGYQCSFNPCSKTYKMKIKQIDSNVHELTFSDFDNPSQTGENWRVCRTFIWTIQNVTNNC